MLKIAFTFQFKSRVIRKAGEGGANLGSGPNNGRQAAVEDRKARGKLSNTD